MPKKIAIDYGTKRLGIATSDETNTIAIPKPYIETQNKEKLIKFIKENDIGEILLGLPKGLGGQETAMTREVRDFSVWLEQETKLPVRLIDERLSTQAAQRITKDRELLDSLVAQKLLENYLEQLE